MPGNTEYVELAVSDGTTMRAYVARPANPDAGLIVFQEAFGVNAHIRDVTERFAREGYLAIAPELFHRSGPGFESGYTDFSAVRPHIEKLTNEGLSADAKAAFDWLQQQPGGLGIAATGYCMGGRTAFLAALDLPLRCTISYYGGGIAPHPMFPGLLDRVNDLKAPVLFFWGGRDQHIKPEAVRAITDALRNANKTFVNVEFSDADHGFFCDARASYNPTASAQAWPLTLAFLRVHLAGSKQAQA